MRLQSIKLAGFKSFAEPTQFQLPGQLVGVVGPNGCGKSNIMDAVRWVLGESKASELRGESMQDVIFNGSGNRKPASRASVELVFDNHDQRASGPWGRYDEIAVKRVLTRDGQSSYLLNNQVVRRRDVQDLFLGTGLGPRAYAIIGQGTISRIIESKPEELRLFLEEAAGVSKYKERRRETAHRLEDTQQNLSRVEDILLELNNQLVKLGEQAETAKTYQALSDTHQRRQQQLWFLKRQDAQAEQTRVQHEGLQALNAFEAGVAELRQCEADGEVLRQRHYEAGDQVQKAQDALYQATTAVAQLEAQQRYMQSSRRQLQQRIDQTHAQLQQWRAQAQDMTLRLADWQAQYDEAELQAAQLTEELDLYQADESAQWARVQAAQQAVEAIRHEATQVQQQLQVLASQQKGWREQLEQLNRQAQALQQRQPEQDAPDPAALEALQAQHDEAQMTLELLSEQQMATQAATEDAATQRDAAQHAVQTAQRDWATLQANLQAQQRLLSQLEQQDGLQAWLTKHGLDHLKPLWQKVHIAPEWTRAVEAVLGSRLQALSLKQLHWLKSFQNDLPSSATTFIGAAAPVSSTPASDALIHHLQCPDVLVQGWLSHWLTGLRTTPSLAQALAQLDQLADGERWVTPEGHVVAAHEVNTRGQGSSTGLVGVSQEVSHLKEQQPVAQQALSTAQSQLHQAQAQHAHTVAQAQSTERDIQALQKQLHQNEVQLLRMQQLAQQAEERARFTANRKAEIQASQTLLQAQLDDASTQWEVLDEALMTVQQRQMDAQDAHLAADHAWKQWQTQGRTLVQQTQEAQFGLRQLTQQREQWQSQLATAEVQMTQARDSLDALQLEHALLEEDESSQALEQAVAQQFEAEQTLAQCRAQHDEAAHLLRALETQRQQFEKALEPKRQAIMGWQLKEQAATLAYQQFDQQLTEAQADLMALEASIAEEGVKLSGLASEIDRTAKAIEALGPVNLAALQELEATQTRQTYLHNQHQDLVQAIETMTQAIKQIDAETRTLLQATFDAVNKQFGTLFPELFGGGQARLIMTEDDILETGVQVMAQPPGKRNQTIHLLSGGEKALTAIALVFAMFQLNPAPFCLLDEVDAPLDDANTARYARLVSKMSTVTQFLFISHNKIAMEMARQLVGVTMQEQGVSRIVAVDMEQAAELMEA